MTSDALSRFAVRYRTADVHGKSQLALLVARTFSVSLREFYRTERVLDAGELARGNELLIRLLSAAAGLVAPGEPAYPDDSLLPLLEEYQLEARGGHERLLWVLSKTLTHLAVVEGLSRGP